MIVCFEGLPESRIEDGISWDLNCLLPEGGEIALPIFKMWLHHSS